jgi:hypothetical protein
MNSIQRRLFRSFIEAGGDVAEAVQVEQFIRYVEAVLTILPPKVKAAIDLAWRAEDMPRYERMAARLSQPGLSVSASALRQRVSRGLRFTEHAIRRRSWSAVVPAATDARGRPARSRSSAD